MKIEKRKELMTKSENAAVEFKRAKGGVPADFWPSYNAFANTDGGTIILGIREKDGKREIEGLQDAERTVPDIWETRLTIQRRLARMFCSTSPSILSRWTAM